MCVHPTGYTMSHIHARVQRGGKKISRGEGGTCGEVPTLATHMLGHNSPPSPSTSCRKQGQIGAAEGYGARRWQKCSPQKLITIFEYMGFIYYRGLRKKKNPLEGSVGDENLWTNSSGRHRTNNLKAKSEGKCVGNLFFRWGQGR